MVYKILHEEKEDNEDPLCESKRSKGVSDVIIISAAILGLALVFGIKPPQESPHDNRKPTISLLRKKVEKPATHDNQKKALNPDVMNVRFLR